MRPLSFRVRLVLALFILGVLAYRVRARLSERNLLAPGKSFI